MSRLVSRQIHAMLDLCCIVSRELVESVGGVFDPVVSSAIAVFEHVKDERAVVPNAHTRQIPDSLTSIPASITCDSCIT